MKELLRVRARQISAIANKNHKKWQYHRICYPLLLFRWGKQWTKVGHKKSKIDSTCTSILVLVAWRRFSTKPIDPHSVSFLLLFSCLYSLYSSSPSSQHDPSIPPCVSLSDFNIDSHLLNGFFINFFVPARIVGQFILISTSFCSNRLFQYFKKIAPFVFFFLTVSRYRFKSKVTVAKVSPSHCIHFCLYLTKYRIAAGV